MSTPWSLVSDGSKPWSTFGFWDKKLSAANESFLKGTYPVYSSGKLTLWTQKKLNLRKIYVARISRGKNGRTLFRDLQIYELARRKLAANQCQRSQPSLRKSRGPAKVPRRTTSAKISSSAVRSPTRKRKR